VEGEGGRRLGALVLAHPGLSMVAEPERRGMPAGDRSGGR
jgi:hypothetical protein